MIEEREGGEKRGGGRDGERVRGSEPQHTTCDNSHLRRWPPRIPSSTPPARSRISG